MAKKKYLTVQDHSVSKETFDLLYNVELQMLETVPQPELSELQKYYHSDDYISHTDGNRTLFERVYQLVKGFALKRKLKLIDSFNTTEKELLDVGCGTGDFLKIAQNYGWDVTGIEPNKNARNRACNKLGEAVYDPRKLRELSPESYDVITLWHVLEHLPKLDEHIKILEKLLKKNGRLVIAVPNYKSFDASYYKEYWAAYDVPRHLWHFSKNAIKLLFNKRNMNVEKILPLKFDAYYVCLLSEKYKVGWMNIFSAFFIASRSNLKGATNGEYSSLIYILKKG